MLGILSSRVVNKFFIQPSLFYDLKKYLLSLFYMETTQVSPMCLLGISLQTFRSTQLYNNTRTKFLEILNGNWILLDGF